MLVKIRDQGGNAATRYLATVGDFTAASWSPEAAAAVVLQMQKFAREITGP